MGGPNSPLVSQTNSVHSQLYNTIVIFEVVLELGGRKGGVGGRVGGRQMGEPLVSQTNSG